MTGTYRARAGVTSVEEHVDVVQVCLAAAVIDEAVAPDVPHEDVLDQHPRVVDVVVGGLPACRVLLPVDAPACRLVGPVPVQGKAAHRDELGVRVDRPVRGEPVGDEVGVRAVDEAEARAAHGRTLEPHPSAQHERPSVPGVWGDEHPAPACRLGRVDGSLDRLAAWLFTAAVVAP